MARALPLATLPHAQHNVPGGRLTTNPLRNPLRLRIDSKQERVTIVGRLLE